MEKTPTPIPKTKIPSFMILKMENDNKLYETMNKEKSDVEKMTYCSNIKDIIEQLNNIKDDINIYSNSIVIDLKMIAYKYYSAFNSEYNILIKIEPSFDCIYNVVSTHSKIFNKSESESDKKKLLTDYKNFTKNIIELNAIHNTITINNNNLDNQIFAKNMTGFVSSAKKSAEEILEFCNIYNKTLDFFHNYGITPDNITNSAYYTIIKSVYSFVENPKLLTNPELINTLLDIDKKVFYVNNIVAKIHKYMYENQQMCKLYDATNTKIKNETKMEFLIIDMKNILDLAKIIENINNEYIRKITGNSNDKVEITTQSFLKKDVLIVDVENIEPGEKKKIIDILFRFFKIYALIYESNFNISLITSDYAIDKLI